MAKVPTGNGAQAPKQYEDTNVKRAVELSNVLEPRLWEVWREFQIAETVLTPDIFYKQTCMVLMHMAAVIAVDVGLTDAQLVGMSKLMWDRANERAPKFS